MALPDLLCESIYSRLAEYEDVNDAERLSQDPTVWLFGSTKIWTRCRLPSRLHGSKPAESRREPGRSEQHQATTAAERRSHECAAGMGLDWDSTEILVYGEQEPIEFTCHHPLVLFHSELLKESTWHGAGRNSSTAAFSFLAGFFMLQVVLRALRRRDSSAAIPRCG